MTMQPWWMFSSKNLTNPPILECSCCISWSHISIAPIGDFILLKKLLLLSIDISLYSWKSYTELAYYWWILFLPSSGSFFFSALVEQLFFYFSSLFGCTSLNLLCIHAESLLRIVGHSTHKIYFFFYNLYQI